MTEVELKLFVLAGICVTASTIGYLLSLVVKKVQLARLSTWILLGGFVFLALSLILIASHSTGWSNFGSRCFLSLYAWAISGIYLGMQIKTKTRVLGAFVAPLILLFIIAAVGQQSDKNLVPLPWQGWLTALHLLLAIAGEALFVLAAAAGAMFIIQDNLLKHKKPGKMSRFLPSLGDLDRINQSGLLWGFVLLTFGMIAGALYAAFVWEGRWFSDPKIIWALATWVVYGFLLHQRLAIGWKGFRMAALSCVVFVLFFTSALAIRFYLPTIHSFI